MKYAKLFLAAACALSLAACTSPAEDEEVKKTENVVDEDDKKPSTKPRRKMQPPTKTAAWMPITAHRKTAIPTRRKCRLPLTNSRKTNRKPTWTRTRTTECSETIQAADVISAACFQLMA